MITKYAYIGIIFLLLVTVMPVSAEPITYSQEYYSLGSIVDKYLFDKTILNQWGESTFGWYDNIGVFASLANTRELRRQSILLEKQNELISEQNRIAWINTCYVPHDIYGVVQSSNITPLETECANAGYPTITGKW